MEAATRVPSVPTESQELADMLEMLKTEHAECLRGGELWDANSVQNLILNFLYDVRTGEAWSATTSRRLQKRLER